MKRNAANRPGSLTCAFKGGPVGMHSVMPSGERLRNVYIADNSIEDHDGFVMIIACQGTWRLVLTTTRKLGWVDAHDLGVGSVPGTVYHIDWSK